MDLRAFRKGAAGLDLSVPEAARLAVNAGDGGRQSRIVRRAGLGIVDGSGGLEIAVRVAGDGGGDDLGRERAHLLALDGQRALGGEPDHEPLQRPTNLEQLELLEHVDGRHQDAASGVDLDIALEPQPLQGLANRRAAAA